MLERVDRPKIRMLRPEQLRPDVRRWAAVSAFAVALLTITEFLVQVTTVGAAPALGQEDASATATAAGAHGSILVVMIDTFLMCALVVFLASFRQLITHARQDLQWVADLSYGAGLVFVAITLVGDAMAAGSALDTVGQQGDPSAIRALSEGHLLLFGSIGCTTTALFVAAAGYVIFATDVLHRWAAWLAWVVALLNIATVPAMFGGTDPRDPFSAGGVGVTALATFPFLLWVTVVGLSALRARD